MPNEIAPIRLTSQVNDSRNFMAQKKNTGFNSNCLIEQGESKNRYLAQSMKGAYRKIEG